MYTQLIVLAVVAIGVNSAPTANHAKYNFTMNKKIRDWEVYYPGGDTKCAHGDDYAFFFREGKDENKDKLVIQFEGGGACWDFATCLLPIWKKDVNPEKSINDPDYSFYLDKGIRDDAVEENPVKDYPMLLIAYCTADAHMGLNSRSVRGMNFNGRANAGAALEFVKTKVRDPKEVLTTGPSAGNLAGLMWTAHINEMYPNAKHTQFGDSYVGVVSPDHMTKLTNAYDLVPGFLPKLRITESSLSSRGTDAVVYIWEVTSQYFPDCFFSQLTSEHDAVQDAFYVLGGGHLSDFVPQLRAHLYALRKDLPNFGYYIMQGTQHTYTPKRDFFKRGVPDAISINDYLVGIIGGTLRGSPNQYVDCNGDGETCGKSDIDKATFNATQILIDNVKPYKHKN